MEDTYKTIRARERTEIKVKGSRFIASVAPARIKDEAQSFVDSIRKEYFDATHNCYAYRFGSDGLQFRAADDGEPSGSAGKPILFILQKFAVSDIVLVVTRYFGGTKLGVGGLARAYSDSAESVLKQCELMDVFHTKQVKIFCIYEDISAIKRLLAVYAVRFEEDYHDAVEFIADIPQSKVNEFLLAVTSVTNARAGTVLL